MTYAQALDSLVMRLVTAGYEPSHAQEVAWNVMIFISKKDRTRLLINRTDPMSGAELESLEQCMRDIIDHAKPLAYVIGTVPFLGLELAIRPPILIPRPETEWWCELCIERLKKRQASPVKILDMCTGSGCCALALAHAFPESAVYAVDINPEAIKLARENAEKNSLSNVTFIESDLFTRVSPEFRFDCIVSNPPYISEKELVTLDRSVALWEDKRALIAPEEGLLLINKIVEALPQRLALGGEAWIEFGAEQASSVSMLAQQLEGFEHQILQDQYGRDRVVILTCYRHHMSR